MATPTPVPPLDESPQSLLASFGQFQMQKLTPMQAALRQRLIDFSVAIALLTIYVLAVRSHEMPPRPPLSASAEMQAVYREQREEANGDAKSDFELVGAGFLIPTFTALLGYFVGVKVEYKEGD